MCLYPRLIRNKKYVMNKKNGGIVPAICDNRVLTVPIGCGKCIECMKMKSREWQVRLMEDIKHHKNGKFVTLTFNDESIREISKEIKGLKGYEKDNEIAKKAVRWFLERWRKKYKKSIRHWLVTEIGHNGTENIHMHGIVWTNESLEEVEKIWKYGWVWKDKEGVNFVNEKTVNYLTKYVTKVDADHKYYKAKILTSAGIGGGYMERTDAIKNKYKEEGTKETYTTTTGHQIAMPIYWRNKIYDEEEKEKLWLEKLDKQERWVCGEKVSIADGDVEYYKMLEYYRRKNKRLGYGDDEINWDRKKYEQERRNIKQKVRIAKAEAVFKKGLASHEK